MSILKGLALIILFSSSLMATEHFDKTFPVSKNPSVMLTTYTGNVIIKGWQRPEVRVTAANYTQNVEIDSEPMGNKVRITTHVLDKLSTAEKAKVDYQIYVPEETNLDLKSNMGSLQVENVKGEIAIEVANANVSVQGVSGYLHARSLGSTLVISNSGGIIQTTTVSGDILFDHLLSESVNANSTLGNISYEGDFVNRGKYIFSTNAGLIMIRCSDQASVEWDAKTVKGAIESEIPITSKKHSPVSRSIERQSLLGTSNRGEATVQLSTFSGKIKISRK